MDSKAFKWLEENQLSYDIWNKKYRFQGESFDEWLNRVSGNDEAVKQLIMDKKFLFGGRIYSRIIIRRRCISIRLCWARHLRLR